MMTTTICRYCRHSEARRAWWPAKGPESLICWHRKAPVRPEGACEAYEREAGVDDDLGNKDEADKS